MDMGTDEAARKIFYVSLCFLVELNGPEQQHPGLKSAPNDI